MSELEPEGYGDRADEATAVMSWAGFVRYAEDWQTLAADGAADLIARGASLRKLGAALGLTRQSVTERFAWSPSARESARAVARARAWLPDAGHVRLSAYGRFVVFYDGRQWRVIRHTPTDTAALELAEWLGNDAGLFRFIRKPRDLDGAVAWRHPRQGVEAL